MKVKFTQPDREVLYSLIFHVANQFSGRENKRQAHKLARKFQGSGTNVNLKAEESMMVLRLAKMASEHGQGKAKEETLAALKLAQETLIRRIQGEQSGSA